jgi:hypothetical protein
MGSHPFPFRTRKLSPSAPMVLGGRLPGRVGRRRISHKRPRFGGAFCRFRMRKGAVPDRCIAPNGRAAVGFPTSVVTGSSGTLPPCLPGLLRPRPVEGQEAPVVRVVRAPAGARELARARPAARPAPVGPRPVRAARDRRRRDQARRERVPAHRGRVPARRGRARDPARPPGVGPAPADRVVGATADRLVPGPAAGANGPAVRPRAAAAVATTAVARTDSPPAPTRT